MGFLKFLVSTKLQIFYALLVFLFNIVAVYYLFFFSSSKINLDLFIPSATQIQQGVTKPITDILKKFVYQAPKKAAAKVAPTATPTQAPVSPTPQANDLIDCIGPDGKQAWLTQKDCDSFNKAWQTTPTPLPSQDNSASQSATSY